MIAEQNKRQLLVLTRILIVVDCHLRGIKLPIMLMLCSQDGMTNNNILTMYRILTVDSIATTEQCLTAHTLMLLDSLRDPQNYLYLFSCYYSR